MKIPILDISSKIIHMDIDKTIYRIELKFGELKFYLKLSGSNILELLKAIIQEKEIAFKTEIKCSPLPQDRRKKYFEISDKTFNPRMIDG